MTEVRATEDVERFLAEAEPLLLEDEARNNLMLGIAATVRDSPELYPEHRFWLVYEDGSLAGAALRTPPYSLVVAPPRTDAALESLVEEVGRGIPGVVGAVPEVDTFARLWTKRYGGEAKLTISQGVWSLWQVAAVPRPPGALRDATRDEVPLLTDWWNAFAEEAVPPDERHHREAEELVAHRLAADDAGAVLWEDGGAVSFAAYGGPTPNGIRIGPVYTPPEHRGRGYATALVADLSQRLLDEGRAFCFLYTDLANPTSNAIYERIGYVRVCDSNRIRLSGPG